MKKQYQLVVDENMPCLDELFSDIADIKKLSGRLINQKDLINADALLCRSITQVNRQLLSSTQVKFVGSATIGIDHLDTAWLDKNKIGWASAAGCNAAAVAQYVISAICFWLKSNITKARKPVTVDFSEANELSEVTEQPGFSKLSDLTIGIVGAGNVGSELARCLAILGVNYLFCDPPLADSGDKREFVSFDEIMTCDVITLHVPFIEEGQYKTNHLFDGAKLESLANHQLLINASRGRVIDNHALLNYLNKPNTASVVLDVFENEPHINYKLVQACFLATPHIAGHTVEGKLRGSYYCYLAFCQHFNLKTSHLQEHLFPTNNQLALNNDDTAVEHLLKMYDIEYDSNQLKQCTEAVLSSQFDQLRKNYIDEFNWQPRRDYSGWSLITNNNSSLNHIFSRLTES